MDTTYSSPVLANFNGQMAIVFGAGDGSVYAMQPRTGKILWNYDASLHGINTTPTVVGNTVYCGHGEENVFDTTVMGAFFAIDGTGTGNVTKTKELWIAPKKIIGARRRCSSTTGCTRSTTARRCGSSTPKRAQTSASRDSGGGDVRQSALCRREDLLREASGHVLHPRTDGKGSEGRSTACGWRTQLMQGSPIVSHGRLYIPTQRGAVLHRPQGPGRAAGRSAADADSRDALPPTDPKPAQLQITPVESLLRPGQKQTFTIRLYNANGRYLGHEDGAGRRTN